MTRKASGYLPLSVQWPVVVTVLLVLAACSRPEELDPGASDPPDKVDDSKSGAGIKPPTGIVPTFPTTGINAKTLTVTGIKPATGPFLGGNQAIVRGSGFTDKALVFIGGRMVQPRDTVLQDRNSLAIVLPAGEPGPADVRVEITDEEGKLVEANREAAYTYNRMLLEPTEGSTAGGTSVLITLDGAVLDVDASIAFGNKPCTGVRVISPSQVRCKTPAGGVGITD
ncbi:MAG TPA: IPT/TIG domain-containing protein, partial [Polyangiaceae bacterium]|nr:IPT/TIG domain-containing protein [Polyangiaceae bacterium]